MLTATCALALRAAGANRPAAAIITTKFLSVFIYFPLMRLGISELNNVLPGLLFIFSTCASKPLKAMPCLCPLRR